jgi:hypothetical protein
MSSFGSDLIFERLLWDKAPKALPISSIKKLLYEKNVTESKLDVNWSSQDFPRKPKAKGPRKPRASRKSMKARLVRLILAGAPKGGLSAGLTRIIEDMASQFGSTSGEILTEVKEDEDIDEEEESPEELERKQAQYRLPLFFFSRAGYVNIKPLQTRKSGIPWLNSCISSVAVFTIRSIAYS